MTAATDDVPAAKPAGTPLLSVRDLRVHIRRGNDVVRAVDGLSYDVAPGRALAIVGESGSGKTVGARALMGLLPPGASIESGQVLFSGGSAKQSSAASNAAASNEPGVDLLGLSPEALRRYRGRDIGMVFQNAMEAMNPTVTLRRQLTEHLRWHRICDQAEADRRAVAALAEVGIPEPARRLRMYPFQLSGGMRQRAMIAMAMVARPRLLIADEPTTAVDVTVQRQLIEVLRRVKDSGTSIILITHDLGVARALCDDVLVMYGGRLMEFGPVREVVSAPAHPYTAGLISSSVEVGDSERELTPIPGVPPDLARLPDGCPFQPRCPHAVDECAQPQVVRTVEKDVNREVACWKVGQHAS